MKFFNYHGSMRGESMDKWSRWVLRSSFGGDAEQHEAWLAQLAPIRDRVLANAQTREGDVLLDVGAGDGLIGFAALPLLGETGRVILCDVSEGLVRTCRRTAEELGVEDKCSFLCASAEAMEVLEDESVDVVTTRSVLIYVQDKETALREFFRVLRRGGRISIYEPINSYFKSDPNVFWNYDVTPIVDLANKVSAAYEDPGASKEDHAADPMMNFGERDLLQLARSAGFVEIHMNLEVYIEKGAWATSWSALLSMAGNPLEPTLAEAIASTLTPEEASRFEAHLKPLADAQDGIKEMAAAYVWGSKV
jgi:arsenite methyltransferase